MTIAIREARLADRERWDAYVRAAPDATVFHLWAWRAAIEEAYGHACFYLLAQQEGRVVGVLPLVQIRSRLFGHALVSNAFAVQGGPVGDTPEIVALLADQAIELAERLDAGHLEFRSAGVAGPGWQSKDGVYAAFRRAISDDPADNLKAIPRKQRAVVRKAIDRGLTSEVDEGIDRFFPLYATSVRNLGTPVFPRAWFAALRRAFSADCDILTVTDGGTPVSSVLSFYFRGQVLPYYGGGGLDARRVGANDFMYYDLMCRAGARGCTLFDFGRSKVGTGAFAFKRNFGFEPEPLTYQLYLRRGGRVPDVSPNNPKYRLMIALWSRLPLGVANTLGPLISRHLG
ncbi:MAG: FemAB family XrtA/PEP-CTERM system-associated protein [Sphingomonadales bacterium]